jgi:hypothetical protein
MLETQFIERSRFNRLKFYESPKPQVVMSSEILGWQNIKAVETIHHGFRIEFPAAPRHLVLLILNSPGEIAIEIGGKKNEQSVRAGGIVIIPAETSTILTLQNGQEFRTLQLYLEPDFVRKVAGTYDLGSSLSVVPAIELGDEQLSRIILSVFHELKEANLSSRVFCEVF